MGMLKLLTDMTDEFGKLGMGKAAGVIEDLAQEAKEPWKRTLLDFVADSIEEYGPDGMEKAKRAVERLMRGKDVDLSFVSLRVRSDILAQLQNAEADKMSEARAFMAKIGKVLGAILAAVVKVIVAS